MPANGLYRQPVLSFQSVDYDICTYCLDEEKSPQKPVITFVIILSMEEFTDLITSTKRNIGQLTKIEWIQRIQCYLNHV